MCLNSPAELIKRVSNFHCETSGGSPTVGDVLSIVNYLSGLSSSTDCVFPRSRGSTDSKCVQMARAGPAGSDLCFAGWAGGYDYASFNCNQMGVYLRNMANTCASNGLTGGYQEINLWDYLSTGGGNQGVPTSNEVTINMYHT
ncbi:hypothetical protein AOQ84DRAFT_80933 [Glonium stellatum]|uniref:Uncharacterized protein n=1 Tax=Glonium stellatum TaxID=574774 RepID=A0A8E2EXB7_9PEZI|nr:hypothetical protein AOQ84DRAFT_80933 [Glonium stellatum]